MKQFKFSTMGVIISAFTPTVSGAHKEGLYSLLPLLNTLIAAINNQMVTNVFV